MTMTGFLDGINDSLKIANPIETMDEETVVSLGFDKELNFFFLLKIVNPKRLQAVLVYIFIISHLSPLV